MDLSGNVEACHSLQWNMHLFESCVNEPLVSTLNIAPY